MSLDDQSSTLISCVLPTYNRRGFLPHAIHYFLRQDYPNKELIVVDDGLDSVEDLVPKHPSIQYLRLPRKMTLGAKLNLCCEQARGPVIAQWDDDDWYAADRLSRQWDALRAKNAQVCGISDLLYYELASGRGYRYVYPANERPWLLGSSLFFWRAHWESHRFAEIDVGMDGLFVWATAPEQVYALPEPRFAVHLIHQSNVSPKSPRGAWWSDYPVSSIAEVMGEDWAYYQPAANQALLAPRPRPPQDVPCVTATVTEVAEPDHATPARRLRNVYACLVHEARDCVFDLCRNLRHHDPDSTILLYNGGPDTGLLAAHPVFERTGVIIHPRPRPARWGSLHDFALDCMRLLLEGGSFDTLTIVDSDQLALRSGWTDALQAAIDKEGGTVGLFGNRPERQTADTEISAAITAWREFGLWQPLLRRFTGGDEKFVHWTYWPSTVFTYDAAKELVRLFDQDAMLQHIISSSRLWVTEEIVFPTLTALLGFQIAKSPGSYDYVRYRHAYAPYELEAALSRPDAYWVHPIPRKSDDVLRTWLRGRLGGYGKGESSASETQIVAMVPRTPVTATEPAHIDHVRGFIIAAMQPMPGWLLNEEAHLLITSINKALLDCPDIRAVVEVGSFRGKGTTVLASVVRAIRPSARVWAVDPHDGVVGSADQGLHHTGPTLENFKQNIARAGLEEYVETVQAKASTVAWSEPICFLLIDGLHDYASVSCDFEHFEPFLADSALVAFHDYADYFPGVRAFVDELVASRGYVIVDKVASLVVLRKQAAASVMVAAAG
jgi:hypothetical protein